MKSFLTLLVAGVVTVISGQYFGWWQLSLPGLEMVPSYQAKRDAREDERSARRRLNGMEDEDGKSISDKDTKRRANALKEGEKVGAY